MCSELGTILYRRGTYQGFSFCTSDLLGFTGSVLLRLDDNDVVRTRPVDSLPPEWAPNEWERNLPSPGIGSFALGFFVLGFLTHDTGRGTSLGFSGAGSFKFAKSSKLFVLLSTA
eukprot:m.53083 g.53083  ORF g.53083 m.53083 type:complete len:115 (+) comp10840_c0_seq1:170-514(+)